MVARGDLGLELPLERVPRVQKEITRRARALGVPVIVATQVLESMRDRAAADACRGQRRGQRRVTTASTRSCWRAKPRSARIPCVRCRRSTSSSATPRRFRRSGSPPLEDDAHPARRHGRAICEAAVTLAARGETPRHRRRDPRREDGAPAVGAAPADADLCGHRPADVSRRLALAWGVVPVLTDLSGDVNAAPSRSAGTRRARHDAALLRDRAGEHHARPRARPLEFPEAAAGVGENHGLRIRARRIASDTSVIPKLVNSLTSFQRASRCFFSSSSASMQPVAMMS